MLSLSVGHSTEAGRSCRTTIVELQMNVDAKLREGQAFVVNAASTQAPPPWSFRPIGFLGRIGAWLAAALLALGVFYGVLGAFLPLLIMTVAPEPNLTWKGWVRGGVLSVVCAGFAYASLLGFRRVRRRAVYTRQVTNCGDRPCYATHRSFFRSFQSDGGHIWSPSSLSIAGTIGPHLGPVMLVVLLFNALALVAAAAGQQSFVIGGLGAVAIVGIYNRLGRRKDEIEITRSQLKAVRCDGPLLRLQMAPPPRTALKTIDLVVAPSTAVEFLTQFNRVFPGMLPSSYTSHLHN